MPMMALVGQGEVSSRFWKDRGDCAKPGVEQHRRTFKSLRYNLTPDKPMASLVFTDTETPTAAFLLTNDEDRETAAQIANDTGTAVWTWVITQDMPALPARADTTHI